MTPPPNFRCFDSEEDRFFVFGSFVGADRCQYNNVYDHLLQKWFLVTYAESMGPSRTTCGDEDSNPISDENVIKDLACRACKMCNHNVLSRDKGGSWHTAQDLNADLTRTIVFDRYTDPPSDAIRIEALPITGAVAPSTYVVGQWVSIYKPIASFDGVPRTRTAINFLQKSRGHPHINPLDRVVIDAAGNIRGYTVPFLPMGTLEERRTLRSDWFLQLAKTADEINFTYKTVHCDLFPRNMLVGSSEELRLIDFDQVGTLSFATPDFDASCVLCSVYEAVTKRPSHSGYIDLTINAVDRVNGWVKHLLNPNTPWSAANGVTLDIDPRELRDFICRWKEERQNVKYSWRAFVDGEKCRRHTSTSFTAALARCR